MHNIHPKIVTDERMHPIAVQIDYSDWLAIKKVLQNKKAAPKKNLSRYAGSIQLSEDPLKYQKRIRDEWSSFMICNELTQGDVHKLTFCFNPRIMECFFYQKIV